MHRVVLALLFLALVEPVAAMAQAKAASWDRYDVALAIQPNGDVQATETQTLAFSGSFSHAFRDLGLSRSTGITDVQVSEPNQPYRPGTNQPNTYQVSNPDPNMLRVDWWFPPTENASRTFVLRYVIHGTLRYYPGGDQLYRNEVIYAKRAGPVRQATISVTFP